MSRRQLIHDTIANNPDIRGRFAEHLGEPGIDLTSPRRIFSRDSQRTVSLPKPYIIIGLSTNSAEAMSEDEDFAPHRQFFQIWVHDEGGDYGLIDDVIDLLRPAFRNQVSPEHGVLGCQWLEDSSEFSNQTYNTIFRYARFQYASSGGTS